MTLTLLLLCDNLFRDRGTDIPLLAIVVMLFIAFLLLWFRSKRNLNSKINILGDDISILKDLDVLGFEKGNNENIIAHIPREFGIAGKLFALVMVILFLCAPIYTIFERLL